MSLPRVRNLQDTRDTFYCPSESNSIGRVQYQSGGLICQSTADFIKEETADWKTISNTNTTTTTASAATPATNATTTSHQHDSQSIYSGDIDYPTMLACSQPTAPSILTECQQSSGSLFSIVSAPTVPIAELNQVKQIDTPNGIVIGGGLQATGIVLGLSLGGSARNTFTTTTLSNAASFENAAATTTIEAEALLQQQQQRRPATLQIDTTAYCSSAVGVGGGLQPPASNRTLHSKIFERQISEIEEDDNENLLTISSITARPLIAKSRELRTNRQLQLAESAAAAKHNGGKKKVRLQTSNGNGGNVGGGGGGVGGNGASASSQASVDADPPDGGYGWVIVFGAFSVQFWVAGLVKSYGVLYVEIMETFPHSTATVASWIPAILSALCLALAPLSSALCQRFSCRTVVFIGGLFCAFGLALSFFATSLLHLLLTFGVLTGIGGGLSTTPGIVIVSQYFDSHRALANGICVSGTAAGSFILPVLIKHLAEKFGFHGTIMILGFCMLHVCISATLYKPLEEYSQDMLKNCDDEEETVKPLNEINPSSTGILTNSTYLDTCDDGLNNKYIEHLFLEETKNRLNDLYSGKNANDKPHSSAQESDDEVKDIIGETTFIKPIKKVRSSGIMHSVEDLSTDSTWVYRKHSGTDSNRGSRRRRNVFANDEIISKIQAHLDKPLPPPSVVTTRGLSKSMEIPTPVSNLTELKQNECELGVAQVNKKLGVDDEDVDDDDDGPRTCCERIKMYLDISLLKDPVFILMCLSVTLMSVGCPYMLYYLPAHVISINYNKSEAGYLVAISAVLDLFGRLGLGYLSDLQIFDRKKIYILCIFGAGVAVLTIPSESSLYLVGLSAAVYGFCLGSWYVLMPVLLADIFGTDRISSSYGLVRMFQSIGAISVPPLAGFLRDLSGSYEICFYCMGTCMVLGCLPLLIWSLIENSNSELFDERDNDEGDDVISNP